MNPDDTSTAILGQYATELEASMIAAGLRERGINAHVVGGMTAGFRAEAPGMARVLVPADRLDEARHLVEVIRAEAANIDWSDVDVGEMEE